MIPQRKTPENCRLTRPKISDPKPKTRSTQGKGWMATRRRQIVRLLAVRCIARLDVLCAMNQGLTSCDLWSASLSSAMYCRSVLGKLGGTLCLDSAASPSRKDLYSSPIPPRANLPTARYEGLPTKRLKIVPVDAQLFGSSMPNCNRKKQFS